MSFYIWLILFQHVFSLILATLSLYFSTKIQVNKKHKKLMSPNMLLYFVYVLIYSIFSLPYYIYCILIWCFQEKVYNATVIYLLGITVFMSINLNPFMEFILCIDRCLSITFPNNYGKKCQKLYFILSLTVIFVILIISFSNLLQYYPDYSSNSSPICLFFSCLLKSTKFIIFVKGILVISNFIASIILAFLIKIKINANNGNMRRINKTIVIIISLTVINELFPFILTEIFLIAFNQALFVYIGPFGLTISTITIAISTIMYYKAFAKISVNSISSNTVIKTHS